MRIVNKLKVAVYKLIFPFTNIFYWRRTRVYIPKKCHLVRWFLDTGDYEGANIRLLQSLAEKDSVIFDIGANIGLMSIPLLDHKDCTVVSFEPSPDTAPLLMRTASRSRFSKRWQVIPKAVGNKIGEIDFFMASSDMSAFNGIKDTKRAGDSKRVTVPVTTIDHEWEQCGRPYVSLIKIDVEGAEIQVLEGASRCIVDQKPCILLEWNLTNLKAYNYDPSLLTSWADHNDYRILSVPNLTAVTTIKELKQQMAQTENFLLVPGNRTLSWLSTVLSVELPVNNNSTESHMNSLRGTLERAKKLGFNPQTIFDVGATRGTAALYDAFPHAHHILIEARKENRFCLSDISSKVEKVDYILAAAMKASGVATLNVYPDIDESSMYRKDGGSNQSSETLDVPAISLDDIWSERKLQAPCMLKIDVHGAELDVLEGADNVLSNSEYIILKVSLIQSFIGGPQYCDVIRFMKDRNFVLYDMLESSDRMPDGTISQMDVVFVKEDGMFRNHYFHNIDRDLEVREGQ